MPTPKDPTKLEEYKKKQSLKMKGRIISWKEKISKSNKGNKNALGSMRSTETRRKMSVSKMGNKSRTGTKHSTETKKKIGLANSIKLKGRKNPKQSIFMKQMVGDKGANWRGGISFLTYQAKLEIKAGRQKPTLCEICGGSGRICFDHDHSTGLFRGWICNSCNASLGHVRDRQEVLLKMVDYLNNHGTKN